MKTKQSIIAPVIKSYSLPAFAGIMLALSFPTHNFYIFAWIGLIPLLVNTYNTSSKQAFLKGFVSGLIFFILTIYWIYHSIYHYGHLNLFVSIILVLLLCSYLALFFGAFAAAYSYCMKRTDLPALFVAPVFWTTLEFLRSYAMTGFPWASLGYSQYSFLHFIQIADITGIYGVSFLIVAINGAITDLVIMEKRKIEKPLYSLIPTFTGFGLFFIALVVVFSYGYFRLNQDRPVNEITAAVVQGNIEQDAKWVPEYQKDVLTVYQGLTRQAAAYNPNIIIWPETALPFSFGYHKQLTDELVSFQKETGAYLLTGSIMVKQPDPDKNISVQSSSNSAVLLDKNSKLSYVYDKIHLVPFGEYVPLRSMLFFVDKLAYSIGEYVPGDTYLKANTPFGTFSTLICYEIAFPGLVRKFFTKGGDFIVTITNDAWFGRTKGPYQHFSMAVFRAIENRKPVIRAANTGISGLIDSNGKIVKESSLFERTYQILNVKTDSTMTFYTKCGDIFTYLSIISALFIIMKTRN
ncbi:MAG: apolipoprotein N-acyltransferase [Dissulfurispiraceae bacterium]|jgi:apolipoprotein N-acyltransferase|nr:apolipoprotein N-acyltransferase [Dissulfurispiraceae bacterium]